MNLPIFRAALACAVLLFVAGCRSDSKPSTDGRTEIVLATTTSTEDSGLLDVLVPAFEKANPEYRVRFVSVGTGQALALGRRGDADAVLVHAPDAEEEFVRGGHGLERHPVMRNEFVVVGLPTDPAGVRGARTAAEAFTRIAGDATFISRGDDSGTHKRELAIWKAAGITPRGSWYLDAGQGMGEVLTIADEMGAYTLSDRGTYLAMRSVLRLDVVFEGDRILDNPYHVIAVSDARNAEGAQRFIEWLTGDEAQALIGSFGVEMFGRPLFHPTAPAPAP